MVKQTSLKVRAWVPDRRTRETSSLHHDLMLECVGAELDGTMKFRTLEPDGFKPCRAKGVVGTTLFKSMRENGIFLDGWQEPWHLVTSLADASADGQLVLFLRGTGGEPAKGTTAMMITAKDGADFILEQKNDAEGDYFDVREPGGVSLGTIRLLTDTKADCFMRIPTADRYFIEIVQQLRDQGL